MIDNGFTWTQILIAVVFVLVMAGITMTTVGGVGAAGIWSALGILMFLICSGDRD